MSRLPLVRPGFALLLLLGLALSVSADEAKGTIRSVNAQKSEIILKGVLTDTTYEINKDAKFCLDGKKAKVGDLNEGDRVTIDYQKNEQGRLLASEIRALRKATETTGAVRSVDPKRNLVILKGIVRDSTYQLEKDATVWVNGKEGQLADVKEANQVRITYEQRGDLQMAIEVFVLKNNN
jgi:hypothetical protein